MIGCDELASAVDAAIETFKKLRAEYPKLKGYLVLAHSVQQVGLTSAPLDILTNCDEMVVASTAKREALRLLAEKKQLGSGSASGSAAQRISKELETHLKALQFVPEVQVEVRFDDLRFDVVWALQAHPLIDRELTPQTKSSIRIVLGNLGKLSAKK